MILIALQCALIGYVYANILTQQGMLLGQLANKASIFAAKGNWQEWLMKPLILCGYCFTGQLALWSGVFIVLLKWHAFEVALNCAAYLSLALLLIHLLQKLFDDRT